MRWVNFICSVRNNRKREVLIKSYKWKPYTQTGCKARWIIKTTYNLIIPYGWNPLEPLPYPIECLRKSD